MKTLTFFVLVKLKDHLHETGSDDELQYVITEGKGFQANIHTAVNERAREPKQ